MRAVILIALVGCRFHFDPVAPDAGADGDDPRACNAAGVCVVECTADRPTCDVDCTGARTCVVSCAGACTVTGCGDRACVVRCADGTLAGITGDHATCP
jgi:hypothetical protein